MLVVCMWKLLKGIARILIGPARLKKVSAPTDPAQKAHKPAPYAKRTKARYERAKPQFEGAEERQTNGTKDNSYKIKAKSDAAVRANFSGMAKAQVLFVQDGDTVVVSILEDENRVRLDSIDCPENGQPWGDTARHGLIKLIGGKTILMEQHGQDHHGRTLATLYCFDLNKQEWMNVNERMLMLGHAWVLRRYFDHLPPERQHKLIRIEKWARTKRVGLWHELNPIPPWRWRNDRRKPPTPT
jgi:micrococcal nuclease